MKPEQLTERIQNATERLAALKAKELLRQLRAQQRAASLARKDGSKQRQAFGAAVMDAGFGQWHELEVLGLLLDAKERLPGTPETLATLRQRAGRFLAQHGRLAIAERPEHATAVVAGAEKKGRAPAWLATETGNSS